MPVRYEIVKHNESLFSVVEVGRGKGRYFALRDFRNFVAECDSREKAEAIVRKMEKL